MAEPNNICPKAPFVPSWAESSATYRDLVNREFKEQGVDATWTGDKAWGRVNFPDSNLDPVKDEVLIHQTQWQKYVAGSGSQNGALQLFQIDLCNVLAVVEQKRREVVKDGYAQWLIVPNLTHARHDRLNPAERAWLASVKQELSFHANAIYARQANYNYEALNTWMTGYGDFFSRRQFSRLMTPTIDLAKDGKSKEQIQFAETYGNAFPWYPNNPAFNAMFPQDFSADELAYINKNFHEFDLIRMPYSVIERTTASEAVAFTAQKNKLGQIVAAIVHGPDDNLYKVTNMAFHPTYRPHFLAMAEVLRRNASLTIRTGNKISALQPQFKQYTLAMASAFEQGDFVGLLQADLAQTDGLLYLSIFPHEGYWPDNVKYPLMLQLGIREMGGEEDAALLSKITEYLEERSAKVLEPINGYKARTFSAAEALKSGALLVWHENTAGLAGAVPNIEVGGNDYPKRPYPGITDQHRSIVWLDSIIGMVPLYHRYGQKFLSPDFMGMMSTDGSGDISKVLGHEATHGVGMRPQSLTASGRSFSDVQGEAWGLLVEPLADWGSIAGWGEMYKRGHISRQKLSHIVHSQVFKLFRTVKDKASITSEKAFQSTGHAVGDMAQFGAYTSGGAIHMTPGTHMFTVDVDKMVDIATAEFDRTTAFSGQDDVKGYHAYLRESVNKVPDDILAYLLEAKIKHGRPYAMINRDRVQ